MDSLTSGFNIATKISAKSEFNSMVGFTADELSQVVDETVDFSRIPGVTKSQIMDIMERYYDGYVFSPESDEHVFNTNMCQVFLKNLIDQRHIPY
ncbi:MAG: AAA family ATPase [Aeromonadales bacterium]|nr:AAA family ATPase [Aeromonadales bacterium]MDY2891352.1 AAA family ATPase [Succinivibrio sp.]